VDGVHRRGWNHGSSTSANSVANDGFKPVKMSVAVTSVASSADLSRATAAATTTASKDPPDMNPHEYYGGTRAMFRRWRYRLGFPPSKLARPLLGVSQHVLDAFARGRRVDTAWHAAVLTMVDLETSNDLYDEWTRIANDKDLAQAVWLERHRVHRDVRKASKTYALKQTGLTMGDWYAWAMDVAGGFVSMGLSKQARTLNTWLDRLWSTFRHRRPGITRDSMTATEHDAWTQLYGALFAREAAAFHAAMNEARTVRARRYAVEVRPVSRTVTDRIFGTVWTRAGTTTQRRRRRRRRGRSSTLQASKGGTSPA